MPTLTADRIFGGSHKKLLKKPHGETSFLFTPTDFGAFENAHRVENARLMPCRVNSMALRPMKLYHSGVVLPPPYQRPPGAEIPAMGFAASLKSLVKANLLSSFKSGPTPATHKLLLVKRNARS
jgi:hypothetical protein